MKQTQNFQLNQWEQTDRILMEDFNSDNGKIDAALAAGQAAREALAAAVAKCGNCRVTYSSYTGTGTSGSSNPSSLTFPEPPLLAVVVSEDGDLMLLSPEMSGTIRYTASTSSNRVSQAWEGSTVSWYSSSTANSQMNYSGQLYLVLAFYKAD